jgi:hypothetical protein
MPQQIRVELKRGEARWWLGVVAQVKPERWAFVFSFDPAKGVMHQREALGLAPELLAYLESQHVRAIHAHERGSGRLFVTATDVVRDLGVLTMESAEIGPRYHLALEHWHVTRADYRYPKWSGWPIKTLYSSGSAASSVSESQALARELRRPAAPPAEIQPALLEVGS